MRVTASADSAIAPLLERESSLEKLREALAEATAGEGRTVLLHGEAGVGKTALIECFCRESADRARVLVGACEPLFTPRPLGPVADIAELTGGELESLVRDGAIPFRIAAVLLRVLEDGPAILVLEDVHWADEATLDVLRLLARRVADVPALVIATYRDDELETGHPLRVVLGGLASTRAVQRVNLQPLSPGAVARLAEPSGADPDELYRLTSGNPFYVTEVLAESPDDIPQTVKDAVRARIATLSPDAVAVLEALSVVPAGAEPWLLEALADDTGAGLAACLASGVLTVSEDTIAFRHELARLTVEESVAPDRKISLHRRTLKALLTHSRPDLARLAHHADAAGDVEAVLEFAPQAAARASSLGAHREAAAQYRRALRYAPHLPAESRAGLLEQYSFECYLTDEADEAIGALRTARDFYRETGDWTAEGRTLTRLSSILWCPGLGEEAKRVGVEAVGLLEEHPIGPALAHAYDNVAGLLRITGEPAESRGWSEGAVAVAERLGDRATLEYVSGGLALLEIMEGLPGALADFDRRIDNRLGRGREDDAAQMLEGLVLALIHRHPHACAGRYIEDALRYARAQGLDLAHLYALAHRSRLELDQGSWRDAAESAELVLGERFVSTYPRTLAAVTLALVRARRGDPEVWPVLDHALELSEPTGEISRMSAVAVARGEAAWLAGRPAGAVAAETEAAFRLALERGAPRAIGELATVRRRAGLADELPSEVLEPWRHGLRGDWRAAADAWGALGCPYEQALALFDGGEEGALREALDICIRLGARPLASLAARRLRELGVSVPRGPRPSTRESPAGLTSRQAEILELLAAGLRNADIAERLVVSPRTVDHHVSSVLRKLGARTRGEAVAEAARLGLLQHRYPASPT